MEIIKNRQLLERKRFLHAALHNKNITQQEFDKEIHSIEWDLWKNTREAIAQEEARIKSEIVEIRKVVYVDGDLKRTIAKYIIDLLKEYDEDTVKGIFRQGYKIMRQRTK